MTATNANLSLGTRGIIAPVMAGAGDATPFSAGTSAKRIQVVARRNQEITVGLGEFNGFEAQTQTPRAGVRVNSRVPLAVEWMENGKTLRAEGYTVDTSTKGCLAVIPHLFPVGQRLRVINKVNHNVCEAILIWRGHEGRAGWELGLELQEAPMEFWGVDF